MDANVLQWINELPCMSNGIYESMKHITEFKEDMHHIYIRTRKNLARAWTSLQFIAIDDIVDGVMDTWPPAWRRLEAVECNEAVIRWQEEEANHAAQQKRNEQLTAKVQESQEAALVVVGKTPPGGATSTTAKSSQKLPTETVTDEPPTIGTDLPLKHPAQQEWPKPQKKAKASKTNNGVTTLIEGDLNYIENTVRDAARDAVNEAMTEH